jgi:ligand-binding sensor domain-containing protein/signal transduction histidine kinase
MKTLLRLLLLLLSATAFSGAADNSITSSRSHRIWDHTSGFPGGHVFSMTQTPDGYLWFGTGNGLVRYDGLRFDFIPRANSNDLSNGLIPGVLTDASSQLWAADDFTHLFQYEAGRLKGPVPDNGRHDYAVSSVNKTFDGWLLFVSELQGVVEYKHGERRVLLEPRAVPGPPTALAQTADGTIWIGTAEKGLFQFRPERGEASLAQVPSLKNKRINCLLPLANTTLLVGTKQGLFLSQGDNSFSEVSPPPGHDEILALASGLKGRIWIGTERHVFKADPKDINAKGRIRPLEQLMVNGNRTVTALFEDRDGNLWIGEPEAIERYQDSAFITYRSSEGGSEGSSGGLPCSNCGALYVDSDQGIWFAPPDGGLFRISHGRVQSIEIAGLKNDIVYSIAGAAGEVWVGRRNGGLTRLTVEGDTARASPHQQQSESISIPDAVYSVYREPNGTVWAGTLHHGVSRFRSGMWHTFTTKDGLPSDSISVITGNEAGLIFVGTPNGLAEFRPEFKNDRWTSYNTHDGLPPGAIDSLFLDDSATLWIGTSRGIAFLRSGAVHVPLGAPTALYGDILGIAEKNGWLWIATSDHILRVRPSALLKQAYTDGDYREFGISDGLPSVEGIRRSPSVQLDNRGNIWFSLKQGISLLPASAFTDPAFPVTTRIDGMLVDGKYVDGKHVATGDPIRISSGRHRLTFEYAGINVSNPEAALYHYRLTDVDSVWSEPTLLREVDFTNIAPGRFEFQVAASNPDGVWNPNGAVIAFEVEPSILQTPWFQVASVAMLALLALGVYQLRVQQLHRQFNIGLEARVNEQTRIARDLHDTLLQTLHGLMFQFQAVRNLLPRRPEDAIRSLDDAIDETERALAESRDAIQGLRSEATARENLADLLTITMQELTAAAEGTAPIFDLIEEGERRALSTATKNEIYRIALEILRNAFRHSNATRIEAEIRHDNQMLRLRIRDNGRGIDPKVLKEGGRPGHWGLRGIRERAERIGSRLDFWSESGAGTEVQLTVPAAIAYEASREGIVARLLRRMKNGADPS